MRKTGFVGYRISKRARADKVLPGLWRLRLPLPWQATPHGNAYAVAAGDGIVLVDTGFGGKDGLSHLESALAEAEFGLDDIGLVVCTHAHSDHFGCAAAIAERTGAPIWIHPAWEHARPPGDDPDAAIERRLEGALALGVPEAVIERWREERRGSDYGVTGPVDPDRDLLTGVEFDTDLGRWRAYETPGHAPSHVVLHQPERRLLFSGDLIVGRVFLYFDYGHTPDPVGEFLASLDLVEGLDVGLCLAGHGRPFRGIPARVEAYKAEVARQLDGARRSLAEGAKTPWEIVEQWLSMDDPPPSAVGYGLELTRSYLDHLAIRGEVRRIEGSEPERWELASEDGAPAAGAPSEAD